MDSSYTIVVTDTDILSRLCGTNDSNLRLIEEHLGVPVFTRGNELSIPSGDDDVSRRFRVIIDRIMNNMQNGAEPCIDMVQSVLQNCSSGADSGFYRDTFIQVPGGLKRVYPKTANQAEYIRNMQERDLVFCVGPAGSGKTYLAVAEALRRLLSRKKRKLVLTRPVVEAGENLGFLPGDLEQKIHPYLRPLYDAMETLLPRDTLHKLEESGMIEVAPLAYMRGRSLNDCIVILDEAQNTTREQMKMFLTRMGERSQIIVTGDMTQTDLPRRIPSGLSHAIEILGEIEDILIVHLDSADIVRNPLVKKIVQAYEREQYENQI